MKTRLLAAAGAALVALLLSACIVPAAITQPLAVTWRDISHGIKSVFATSKPAAIVTDPSTGKSVDCTVLLHYPDPTPLPAPTGSGYETHLFFEPFRTDPATWNVVCHPLHSIVIMKINQASNSPSILGSAYVPVALRLMKLVYAGPLLPALRWHGDAFVAGRMDVTDFSQNYLIGYGA
jgi:hypothetical protein